MEVLFTNEEFNMTTDREPIELDRNIRYDDEEKKKGKRELKIPWPFIVGGFGLLLIVMLLFVNPSGDEFVDSPPPAELDERETVYAAAGLIEQYLHENDSLPLANDILFTPGLFYEREDERIWSIETESGLYYSSDMNLEEFRTGEL